MELPVRTLIPAEAATTGPDSYSTFPAPNILPAIACPQYSFPSALFPGNATKSWMDTVKLLG